MSRFRVNQAGVSVVFNITDPTDHIQKQIVKHRDFYERDLLDDATSRYSPEMGIVLDVGAHIGNHTLFFAKVLGAKVIAFEPYPETFTQLKANLRSNYISETVLPWQAAAGNRDAWIYMNLDTPNNTGMAKVDLNGSVEARMVRLDDVVKQKVGLIKIDVEGGEMDVLRGAGRILSIDRPILYVETAQFAEVAAVLAQYGYEPFGVYAKTPTYGFAAKKNVSLSATIMAHHKRESSAQSLSRQFDIPITWDTNNDRWDTGRRSLLSFDTTATHHLVLQDDAIAEDNLLLQIKEALQYVPYGRPLCLYIGRVQKFARIWIRQIRRDTSWITMPGINWGVGLVIPTNHIEPAVVYGDSLNLPNYDLRLSRYFEQERIKCWYPWPSLVDHADGPSLVAGRNGGRHAYRYDPGAFDPRGKVVYAPLTR